MKAILILVSALSFIGFARAMQSMASRQSSIRSVMTGDVCAAMKTGRVPSSFRRKYASLCAMKAQSEGERFVNEENRQDEISRSTYSAAGQFQKMMNILEGKEAQPSSFYPNLMTLLLFVESMDPSFDLSSEFLPWYRLKLIHSAGVVSGIEWRVKENDEGYTGIFETGDPYGLIRASLAKSPDPSSKTSVLVPGIALKFFRDEMPSTNFMAMFSLDGQSSWNFFEHRLSNHVDPPEDPVLKLLAKKFRTASLFETKLGLSDMARYTADGLRVNNPSFPYRLFFIPNQDLRQKVMDQLKSQEEVAGDNWYKQLTGNVEPDTILYSVMAQRDPWSTEVVHIADLIVRGESPAPFFPSKVADRRLFFQHVRMEEDFKLRPEWRQYIEERME